MRKFIFAILIAIMAVGLFAQRNPTFDEVSITSSKKNPVVTARVPVTLNSAGAVYIMVKPTATVYMTFALRDISRQVALKVDALNFTNGEAFLPDPSYTLTIYDGATTTNGWNGKKVWNFDAGTVTTNSNVLLCTNADFARDNYDRALLTMTNTPGGLVTGTTYWIIDYTPLSIKLANTMFGSAIVFGTNADAAFGVGTLTFEPKRYDRYFLRSSAQTNTTVAVYQAADITNFALSDYGIVDTYPTAFDGNFVDRRLAANRTYIFIISNQGTYTNKATAAFNFWQ